MLEQNNKNFPSIILKEAMKNKKPWRYLISGFLYSKASFFYSNLQKQLSNNNLKCHTIIWHSTKKCNLRCIHCWVNWWDYKFWEINVENIINKIDDFKSIWVKYFLITWGEAILKERLINLIEKLKENWIKVWLSTNLIVFNEDIIRLLDSIQISLDWYEKEHNFIRNSKFAYSLTTNNLKKIKNSKTKIFTISCVVFPWNIKYLKDFIKYCFNEFPVINSFSLKPIFSYWRAFWNEKLFLNDKDFLRLIRVTKELIYEWYDVFLSWETWYLKQFDCEIKPQRVFDTTWWDSLYIMENWDIKGSDQDFLPIEWNLLIDDIELIWQNWFKTYRNRDDISQECKSCKYYEDCWWWYIPTVFWYDYCKVSYL